MRRQKWKEWDYKIARFNSTHEWSIFRDNGDTTQRLSSDKIWVKEKWHAIRFISEKDAESVFISIRMWWELKTEEEYIDEILKREEESRAKQCWAEL